MERKKILLVDDSRTSIFMETMILRTGPYDLLTAADGAEAVAKALAERPDLILMDVMMPNMTGLEACRVLREKDETRQNAHHPRDHQGRGGQRRGRLCRGVQRLRDQAHQRTGAARKSSRLRGALRRGRSCSLPSLERSGGVRKRALTA